MHHRCLLPVSAVVVVFVAAVLDLLALPRAAEASVAFGGTPTARLFPRGRGGGGLWRKTSNIKKEAARGTGLVTLGEREKGRERQSRGRCEDEGMMLRPKAINLQRATASWSSGRCMCPGCFLTSLAAVPAAGDMDGGAGAGAGAGAGGQGRARTGDPEKERVSEGEVDEGSRAIDRDQGGSDVAVQAGGGTEDSKVVEVMVSALRGYKKLISPLLPPACRFLPTCSVYAIDSIQTYGPVKGMALTVWRLVRCNPLHWGEGGRGYDPPRWPPVPYNYHWP